ncbi:MAG: hypothetical protein HQL19_01080 [Candidatus Omnitrophica bacterium]|nr:hypothetical protein [Candidatus Omnitrophota bacterium]
MSIDQPVAAQPFRAKSTLFFERYAAAEHQNVQMKLMIGLLSALVLVLFVGFVYLASRPKSIYYVPGATSAGISDPGIVPSASVRSFAVAWLMEWLNFTPDTVEGVYARSSKFMAPGMLAQVHARAADELEKVRRDRLSSVFMLSQEPQVEEDKGVFRVIFEGRRGVYMGKEEMSVESQRIILTVLRSAVTKENPFALSISDIRKEEVENGKS